MSEIDRKLEKIRMLLLEHGLEAVRLRGVDWFAWMTGGGSSSVVLSAETGVAEIFVTGRGAWVLTDEIERERLRREEVPGELELWARPWAEPQATEDFVRAQAERIASDRPSAAGEVPLPPAFLAAKRCLLSEELVRYRRLGREAAVVATEVLSRARPDWTERQLAGEAAGALWRLGIEPGLILAGGESRVKQYRHPIPTEAQLGGSAMLVICGRRHGLYANLTRFVFFRELTAEESHRFEVVAAVEAAALGACLPGARLDAILATLSSKYSELGFPEAIRQHHQGGITGYLTREAIARPDTELALEASTAVAWNPSLSGVKIEDTVLVTEHDLEILTMDPNWPTSLVDGRPRPTPWVRA